MKRMLFSIFFCALVFLNLVQTSNASYDPLSIKNNKFGIHILFPEEVSEAANLVNSNGGDWGYVTIPIKSSDKNLVRWQRFMDECRKNHIIPIVRIATDGDYFSKVSWSQPSEYDVLDFANFLNSLSWPTKNRYVVIYNEPNRADEWGGKPDAFEYAQILDYATQIFKQKNPDFFIISAGLDNASVNIENESVNNFTFMEQMQKAVPNIFKDLDGLGSHSYPNPAFSAPPSSSRTGIDSFNYQKAFADGFAGKNLPVFITETGWSSDKVSLETQAQYYIQTFSNFWNDNDIVAVTPFLLRAEQSGFSQFAFIKNDKKSFIYYSYKNFKKEKGEPSLSKDFPESFDSNVFLPTERFQPSKAVNSVFKEINKSSKTFFKWLLKV